MTAPHPNDCPGDAADYFGDYTDGRYDPYAQLQFIYTLSETHLSADGLAFFIGRPGADGIEFAYRAEHSGLWAFYPTEKRWMLVASDIATLEQDWLSGDLKV